MWRFSITYCPLESSATHIKVQATLALGQLLYCEAKEVRRLPGTLHSDLSGPPSLSQYGEAETGIACFALAKTLLHEVANCGQGTQPHATIKIEYVDYPVRREAVRG